MNQLPQHLTEELKSVGYTDDGITWLVEVEMSVAELATAVADKATAGWAAYCNRKAAGEPPPGFTGINDLFK